MAEPECGTSEDESGDEESHSDEEEPLEKDRAKATTTRTDDSDVQSAEQHQSSSSAEAGAKAAPLRKIPQEELDLLLETFGFLTKGSARLQASDCAKFLSSLGVVNPNEALLAEVLQGVSKSEENTVTKAEFADWVARSCHDADPEEELVEIWRLLGGGRHGDGQVRLNDLMQVLNTWGQDEPGLAFSKTELKEFCGGESMSYDHFVRMLTGQFLRPVPSRVSTEV